VPLLDWSRDVRVLTPEQQEAEAKASLQRAVDRVRDYDLRYLGNGATQVTLKADPTHTYYTTRHRCECKDDQHRGAERPCLHRQMVAVFLSLQPEEAPEVRKAQAVADRALWG
jgi:hypothetical protein